MSERWSSSSRWKKDLLQLRQSDNTRRNASIRYKDTLRSRRKDGVVLCVSTVLVCCVVDDVVRRKVLCERCTDISNGSICGYVCVSLERETDPNDEECLRPSRATFAPFQVSLEPQNSRRTHVRSLTHAHTHTHTHICENTYATLQVFSATHLSKIRIWKVE